MKRRLASPVLAALATTLLLAGCFPRPDYSGLPDMSSLAVSAWEEQVPLIDAPRPDDPRRDRLAAFRQAIAPDATVRYALLLPPEGDRGLYGRWAEALGAEGEHMSVVRRAPGMPPALKVVATTVAAPDCSAMLLPPSHVQHDQRATFAFGCATRGNLAAMIDDPADLVAPQAFRGPTAKREATAVRRYLDGKTKSLKQTTVIQNQ